MDISAQFSSLQNKHFLWEFITKNQWFNNIPDSQHNNIKGEFENMIITVKNENKKTTLVEYNKIFLTQMKANLEQIKTNKKSVRFNNLKDRNINSIEEQHKGRQLQFNKDLKEREDDFISLIKRPTPKSVNFKDINRELKIKDMEDHIEKIVEERNVQINTIFKNDKNETIKEEDNKDVQHKDVQNKDAQNKDVDRIKTDTTDTSSIVPIIEIPFKNIETSNKSYFVSNTPNSTLEDTIYAMNNNIHNIMKSQTLILQKLDKIKII